MTGDDFKQVRTGDALAIKARTWNAVMEVTRRDQARRLGSDGGDAALDFDPCFITVKHQNGAYSARSSVVMPQKGVFSADTNKLSADFPCSVDQYREQAVFSCTSDTTFRQGSYYAITCDDYPGPSGKYGLAQIFGVSKVVVDIKDIRHEYANADQTTGSNQSNANLVSGMAGYAKIISPAFGVTRTTGTQWCTVLLGNEQKSFKGNVLASTWDVGNRNLFTVSIDGTTNTINVALTSSIDNARSSAIPPPALYGNSDSLCFLPQTEPRVSQGTNKIDALALSYLVDGDAFLVSLTQTGGGGGGGSNGGATFVYTMKSLTNAQTLGTNLAPTARTRPFGTNTASAASAGICCCNGTTYQLAIALET